MEVVLPTGEIIEVGEGGGRKLRKSSTGFTLKQLFTGHQGTLGIATEATLELVPRPEVEFAAFFAFDDYMKAWETTGDPDQVGPGHDRRRGALRRAEDHLPAPRRRGLHPQPDWVEAVVAVAMYGRRTRSSRRPRRSCGSGEGKGRQVPGRRDLRRRLGLTPRPLRHAAARPRPRRPGRADVLALRGRRAQLLRPPAGARGVARDRRPATASSTGSSTTGACSPTPAARTSRGRTTWWRSTSASGSRAQRRDWAAWVSCKREIAEVSAQVRRLDHRLPRRGQEGDADLVPEEMGSALGRS